MSSYYNRDNINSIYRNLDAFIGGPWRIINDNETLSGLDKQREWKQYLEAQKLDPNIQPFNFTYEQFMQGMTSSKNRANLFNAYKPLISKMQIKDQNKETLNVDKFSIFESTIFPKDLSLTFNQDGNISLSTHLPFDDEAAAHSFENKEIIRETAAIDVLDKLYRGSLEKPEWSDSFIEHMAKREGMKNFMVDGKPFLESEEWMELKDLGIKPRDFYNWYYRENNERFVSSVTAYDNEAWNEIYKKTSDQAKVEIQNTFGDATLNIVEGLDYDRQYQFIQILENLTKFEKFDVKNYRDSNGNINEYKLLNDFGLLVNAEPNWQDECLRLIDENKGGYIEPGDLYGESGYYSSANPMASTIGFHATLLDKQAWEYYGIDLKGSWGNLSKEELSKSNQRYNSYNSDPWERLYIAMTNSETTEHTTQEGWKMDMDLETMNPYYSYLLFKHYDDPGWIDENHSNFKHELAQTPYWLLEGEDNAEAYESYLGHGKRMASMFALNTIQRLDDKDWLNMMFGSFGKTKNVGGDKHKLNSLVNQYLKQDDANAEVVELFNQNNLPSFEMEYYEFQHGTDSNDAAISLDEDGKLTQTGMGDAVLFGGSPERFGIAPIVNIEAIQQEQEVFKQESELIKVNVGVVRSDGKGGWIPVTDPRIVAVFKDAKSLDVTIPNKVTKTGVRTRSGFAEAYGEKNLDAWMDRMAYEKQGYRMVNLENGKILTDAQQTLSQYHKMGDYWNARTLMWYNLFNNEWWQDEEVGLLEGIRQAMSPAASSFLNMGSMGLWDRAFSDRYTGTTELEGFYNLANALDLNQFADKFIASPNHNTRQILDDGLKTHLNMMYRIADTAGFLLPFFLYGGGGTYSWGNTVGKFFPRTPVGRMTNTASFFTFVGTVPKIVDPAISPFGEDYGSTEGVKDEDYTNFSIPFDPYSQHQDIGMVGKGAMTEFALGLVFSKLNVVGYKPKFTKQQIAKLNLDPKTAVEIEAKLEGMAKEMFGGNAAVVMQPDAKKAVFNLFAQGMAGASAGHIHGAVDHFIHRLHDGATFTEVMDEVVENFGWTEEGRKNFYQSVAFMSTLHTLNAVPKNLSGIRLKIVNPMVTTKTVKGHPQIEKTTIKPEAKVSKHGTKHPVNVLSFDNIKAAPIWKRAEYEAFLKHVGETQLIIEDIVNGIFSPEAQKYFGKDYMKTVPEYIMQPSNIPEINYKKMVWLTQNSGFKERYISKQIDIIKSMEGMQIVNKQGKVEEFSKQYVDVLIDEFMTGYLANLNNPTYFSYAKIVELEQKLTDLAYVKRTYDAYMKQLKADNPKQYAEYQKQSALLNKAEIE